MGDAMAVDVVGTAAAASPRPKPGAGDAPARLAFDPVLSLEGHEKGVSSLRFSPDGTRLASASADKTVRIWRVADGTCLATLVGHEKGCSECAWSKCGRYVVSASDDKNVHLWCVDPRASHAPESVDDDAANANETQLHDDAMDTADVHPEDQPSRRTRAVFGECLRVFSGHTAHVFSLDLSPAGNVLATGSVDETVRLWDVTRGTCMNVLPAHSDPVTSVRFSPDGTTVCSGSYDGLVRLWSVATGACLRTFRAGPGDAARRARNNRDVAAPSGVFLDAAPPPPVGHVRFSPNGLFLLVSTLDGRARLLATETGAVAKTFEGHANAKFCVVSAFARVATESESESETESFTCVISGSEDGAACAWEIQSRCLVGRAGTRAEPVPGSIGDGGEDEGAGGPSARGRFGGDERAAHADAVVGVDFCSGTQTLATCGLERDKTVKLWRARVMP